MLGCDVARPAFHCRVGAARGCHWSAMGGSMAEVAWPLAGWVPWLCDFRCRELKQESFVLSGVYAGVFCFWLLRCCFDTF